MKNNKVRAKKRYLKKHISELDIKNNSIFITHNLNSNCIQELIDVLKEFEPDKKFCILNFIADEDIKSLDDESLKNLHNELTAIVNERDIK